MRNRRRYTISNGRTVLTLEDADEGGFIVTSPFDRGLFTQAESLCEAFENARDARRALTASRQKMLTNLRLARKSNA